MHHARVVDVNLTRDKFTRHGLHMNSSGKERLAKIIGQAIMTLSTSGTPPISLKWEEVPMVTSSVETKMGSTNMSDDGVNKNLARSSNRSKRPLVTRNDFLWAACPSKPV